MCLVILVLCMVGVFHHSFCWFIWFNVSQVKMNFLCKIQLLKCKDWQKSQNGRDFFKNLFCCLEYIKNKAYSAISAYLGNHTSEIVTTYTETHEFGGPKQLRGMHDHFEVKTSLISQTMSCVYIFVWEKERERDGVEVGRNNREKAWTF